ncbi:hypothetical protein QF026_008379 [Streptomyces aurantiacus]|nr:hypothetical protein [Streptomyces aurantiacus]
MPSSAYMAVRCLSSAESATTHFPNATACEPSATEWVQRALPLRVLSPVTHWRLSVDQAGPFRSFTTTVLSRTITGVENSIPAENRHADFPVATFSRAAVTPSPPQYSASPETRQPLSASSAPYRTVFVRNVVSHGRQPSGMLGAGLREAVWPAPASSPLPPAVLPGQCATAVPTPVTTNPAASEASSTRRLGDCRRRTVSPATTPGVAGGGSAIVGVSAEPSVGSASNSGSSSASPGRRSGSFSRHRATIERNGSGTPFSTGGVCATLYAVANEDPASNGPCQGSGRSRSAPGCRWPGKSRSR